MHRPTFFISSTIYDFSDLRSALKFYLEEQGCRVLASEFNDFEKPLDQHSYEACLEAMQSADYFILLIGTRVGGWYDQPNRISITQREYQEAYRLHIAGRLKILNFVRSEVWQAKDDRRELSRCLEKLSLESSVRAAIENFSAKSAEDASFLIRFIQEVSRNEETKQAIHGKGPAPTGNWIHVFRGFRDIVDVLSAHAFLSVPVEEKTVRRLLRGELREFVRQCLLKSRKDVFSPRVFIENFHKEHPITLESRANDMTTVAVKRWDLTSSLAIHLVALKFHPVVLPQVLSRPTFLEFDIRSDSFIETPVHTALVRLQTEIRRFNEANTADTLSLVYAHSPRRRPTNASSVEVETVKLATLLHLLDRWSNVLDLSAAILKYLDGGPFKFPDLRPDSPVQGMQAQLDAERPSEEEISAFLMSYVASTVG